MSGVWTNTVITTKKISHNTCFALRQAHSVCLANLDAPSSGGSGDFPVIKGILLGIIASRWLAKYFFSQRINSPVQMVCV